MREMNLNANDLYGETLDVSRRVLMARQFDIVDSLSCVAGNV